MNLEKYLSTLINNYLLIYVLLITIIIITINIINFYTCPYK